MKAIKVLDCTLRDGGYYNNWDFKKPLIQKYLNDISSQEINFIEIGFRSLFDPNDKGITFKVTDSILNSLKLPKKIKIGVMVNAADFLKDKDNMIKLCKKNFVKSKNSKLKFIRIAAHIHEAMQISPAIKWLKKSGYFVCLNVMQVSEIKPEEIKSICKISILNKIDVLYLADSLGCLRSNDLALIIKKFKKFWKGNLGIHAHDNLSQALSNSVLASKFGVNFIDCTLTGMGRGPGNAKTEEILEKFNLLSPQKKMKLRTLINVCFMPLKKKYKWGTNEYYKKAAFLKIHPTYIQEILADKRYKKKDYNGIITNLAKSDAKKFSPFKLFFSHKIFGEKPSGSWLPRRDLKDKNLIFLGPGSNLKRFKYKIENIINRSDYVTIAFNTNEVIKENLINFRLVCHPMRILSDSRFHSKNKTNMIAPFAMLPKQFQDLMNSNNKIIFDYGLNISKKKNEKVFENYCILKEPLAISYALSIAIAGRAKSISLAGFDGSAGLGTYKDNTNSILKNFRKLNKNINLTTLTPSKYKIRKLAI